MGCGPPGGSDAGGGAVALAKPPIPPAVSLYSDSPIRSKVMWQTSDARLGITSTCAHRTRRAWGDAEMCGRLEGAVGAGRDSDLDGGEVEVWHEHPEHDKAAREHRKGGHNLREERGEPVGSPLPASLPGARRSPHTARSSIPLTPRV